MSFLEESPELGLNLQAFEHLRAMRRWAAFCSLSILSVLGIIVAFILAGQLSDLSMDPTMAIIGGFSLAYSIPFIYLYRFADESKKAVVQHDRNALGLSLKYLKIHFCALAIVFLIMVVMMIGAFVSDINY